MFDGLLKSKFYSKCKSDLKLISTGIELIRKKRNAVQKYLKNDVADLLKNGSDMNAYGRAEGLIVELNRSSCYEFIDQCCEHISKNLSAMNKQRECPEDCREAASSLMFAAARFADLPELRELRTIFSERYGNFLDCYVNKEFAEKLKPGLPSKDMKIQLLKDMAAEFGLKWNSKVLENKLSNESAYNKNFAKEINDGEYSLRNNTDGSVQKKDKLMYAREFSLDERKKYLPYEPKASTRNEDIFPLKKGSAAPPRDHDIGPPLLKRQQAPPLKDIPVDTIVKTEKPIERASVRNILDEEHEDKPLKYRSIPPPYTKSVGNNKPKDKDETSVEETHNGQDDSVVKASVRRRNLKPPHGREISGSSEDAEKDMLKRANKEKAAQCQRILKFLDNSGYEKRDDEEKVMDKLLQHYSRQKVGPGGKGKPESVHKSRDGPNRSSSLRGVLASTTETAKKLTRAASFQPELLNGNNAHVHPKLPDYDDFVARLAAFRRN